MSCINPNIVDMATGPYFLGPANSMIKKKGEKLLKEQLTAGKWALVPCGNCIECRKSQRRNWANRLTLEKLYHKNAIFATFTYDNEHIPMGVYCNKETGEVITQNYTLQYKDFQDFIKRLRRYAEYHKLPNAKNIMYYACGEYGDRTHRPHYHAIIYDFDMDKSKIKLMSMSGGKYVWKSQEIEDIWKNGLTEFEDVNWNNCAYVAGYCIKKIGKTKDRARIYEIQGQQPEKQWMSQGIGKKWIEENWSKVYPDDKIYLPNGKVAKPPRYFDKIYDEICIGSALNAEEQAEFEDAEANLSRLKSPEMKEISEKRRKLAQQEQENLWKKTRIGMDEYWNNIKERAMKEWTLSRGKI